MACEVATSCHLQNSLLSLRLMVLQGLHYFILRAEVNVKPYITLKIGVKRFVSKFLKMSAQVRKNTQIAGLYFLQCATYHIGPRPSPLDTADYPENILFKCAPLNLCPAVPQIVQSAQSITSFLAVLQCSNGTYSPPFCVPQHILCLAKSQCTLNCSLVRDLGPSLQAQILQQCNRRGQSTLRVVPGFHVKLVNCR